MAWPPLSCGSLASQPSRKQGRGSLFYFQQVRETVLPRGHESSFHRPKEARERGHCARGTGGKGPKEISTEFEVLFWTWLLKLSLVKIED